MTASVYLSSRWRALRSDREEPLIAISIRFKAPVPGEREHDGRSRRYRNVQVGPRVAEKAVTATARGAC